MIDMDLKQPVENALDWEPSVDANDIGVSVEEGVVTLRGNVALPAHPRESRNAFVAIRSMTILATILCGLCLLVAPIDALAQGPLAWEIEEFQGRLGGMALSDGALVVSGWARGVNRQDLVVQAVKRGTGALLWSDRDASTPFCRTGELPLLVAGVQDMAFVVANQQVEGVGDAACRILVRA